MRNDQAPANLATLPRYPPHTLAPDTQQLELQLSPRKADICPKCRCMHTGYADAMACRTSTSQREQM